MFLLRSFTDYKNSWSVLFEDLTYCGNGALLNEHWAISTCQCYRPRLKTRAGNYYLNLIEGNEQVYVQNFVRAFELFFKLLFNFRRSSSRIIKHPNYNSISIDNNVMLIKNGFMFVADYDSVVPSIKIYCLLVTSY